MADLTTLLSKFLTSLWSGAIYSAVLGGSTIGIPAIVKQGRVLAQTAAATIATFTVGASDGDFEVSCNVNVVTATTHSFSPEVAYTDETNTARTVTFPIVALNGAWITNSLIANGGGAAPYESPVLHIRCKAATTITIRTNSGGTYTTVSYNASGIIKQVA